MIARRAAALAPAFLLFHSPALKAQADLLPSQFRHQEAHVASTSAPSASSEEDAAAAALLTVGATEGRESASSSCLAQWIDCAVAVDNNNDDSCCAGLQCVPIDAAGNGRCLHLEETCRATCGPPDDDSDVPRSDRVRVNQVGYLRLADKIAVIVDDSPDPISWRVRDVDNNGNNEDAAPIVASGVTEVYGEDAASGDHVHRADFSSLIERGTYRLFVDGVGASFEFGVGPGLYPDLPREAMNYFYFHRMGTEILEEHLVDGRYARPALHPGDEAVSPYPGWCEGCDPLDLRGSWADAGDFGIYAVSHAAAAWTLLNLREAFPRAFDDGTLNLPESGNGFSDLLDEVDYGSRFVRGLLPSDGGLASHKAHDHEWSASFTITIEGENQAARSAMGPSTAATYAVARVNAQLARVWAAEGGDPDRIATLWDAARDAWDRADGAVPKVYNPLEASPGAGVGGGDYPDSRVEDDRYAAACEMYLTAHALVGDDYDVEDDAGIYRTAMSGEYFTAMDQWDWASVAGAGTLSLHAARAYHDLSPVETFWIERNIVSFADRISDAIDAEGYPSNLGYGSGPGEFERYPWGSNSLIANRMIVLAYAFEITGDVSYQKRILRSMDYVMGTNAADVSYVTGYGPKSETDTHDRWAWTVDGDAHWPRGWLSGGPNDELVNDYDTPRDVASAKSYAGPGTAPDAWGSKENTVGWNAPLAWAAWYVENEVAPMLGGCEGGNCAPEAREGIEAGTRANGSAEVVLEASDEDGEVVGWEIVDGPGRGSLSDSPPNLVYTPDAGFVGTDSFTFRAIDDAGAASNVATVTLIVEGCDFVDIFQVPSDFSPFFGQYDYVHVSEDGPDLAGINTPAHNVQWLNPGLFQFSLFWTVAPYYTNLLPCMVNETFGDPSEASFALEGCGVPGLDGEYWAKRRDDDEVWVEKDNRWAIVFTNDAGYVPEFCQSGDNAAQGAIEGAVQGESATTAGPTAAPTTGPSELASDRSTTPPTRAPAYSSLAAVEAVEAEDATPDPTEASINMTATDEPTTSPTDAASERPTASPTKAPAILSLTTTEGETATSNPTDTPTDATTDQPTMNPTKAASDPPTISPTKSPADPSSSPTRGPMTSPTKSPANPSSSPTSGLV